MAKLGHLSAKAAAAAFIASIGIGTGFAADNKAGTAFAMVPYSWTGFYAGVHGGGVWGLNSSPSSATLTTAPNITDPVNFGGASNAAGVIGFHAGYNWQFNSPLVVGAEIDFSWMSLSNHFQSGPLTFNGGAPGPAGNFDTMNARLNWLSSARGRLGYASDRALLYVTGGAAWANIDYNAMRNYNAIPPNNIGSATATSLGWVIGGGSEYKAMTNLVLRLEYLYYSFASSQSFVTTCAPASGCGLTPPVVAYSWGRSSVQVARVGLSYKF